MYRVLKDCYQLQMQHNGIGMNNPLQINLYSGKRISTKRFPSNVNNYQNVSNRNVEMSVQPFSPYSFNNYQIISNANTEMNRQSYPPSPFFVGNKFEQFYFQHSNSYPHTSIDSETFYNTNCKNGNYGSNSLPSPTSTNESIFSPLNASNNDQVKQLINEENITDFPDTADLCITMKLSDEFISFGKSGCPFADACIKRKCYYYIQRNVKNGKILICIDIKDISKYFSVKYVIVITIQDKTCEGEFFIAIINEKKKQLIFSKKTNLKGEYTTILCFCDEKMNEKFRTSFKSYDSKEIGRYYEIFLKDKKIKVINIFIEESKKSPEEFQGDSLNLISEEMCKALKKEVDCMEKRHKVLKDKKIGKDS